MMIVRHVATSRWGQRVIFATFEGDRASVRDLDLVAPLADGPIKLDFGGHRIALGSIRSDLLISGAYQRWGVAAYRVSGTFRELWRRTDLKRVQELSLGFSEMLVAAAIAGKSLHILETETGQTISTVRGASQGQFLGRGDTVLVVGSGWFGTVEARTASFVWKRKIDNVYMLGASSNGRSITAAFSMSSEQNSSIRCYDIEGRDRWSLHLPEGFDYLSVCWCEDLDCWQALSWPSFEGGPYKLEHITEDGVPTELRVFEPRAAHAFSSDGRLLYLSNGDILDTVENRYLEPRKFTDLAD